MQMRRIARNALGVLAISLGAQSALAQSSAFPVKPIRMVVGFGAGGPLDVTTRLVANEMSNDLGQQVVVENRAGASGQIATDAVAKSPADGYTLLSTASTFIVNPLLMAKVASDPARDFVAVSHVAVLPTIVVTAGDAKIAAVKDIVALARSQPGSVSYSSAGNGGPAHLAGAYLANQTGTEMTHIPMRGAAAAINEVMGGRVTYTFYTMTGLKELVQAGKVKPLAITAPKRHPDFPDVPTMTEAGFAGFDDVGAWFGVVAPAGTPPAVVQRLNQSIERALARPDTRAKIAGMGVVPVGGSPEAFKAFLAKDLDRWSALIKAAGIRGD